MGKMKSKAIEPHRINKPIQLLAAWLLGLITIDTVFLTAATRLDSSSWLPIILVIAAVVNVPIFIICLFTLQTKFRPEMQEDSFYTKYLEYGQQTRTQTDINKEINSLKESAFDINNNMFEIMRKIQSQILDIVEKQKQDEEQNSNISEKVHPLISMVTESQAAIDQITKEAEWKMINVQVNDLLPKFKEILNRLLLKNINIYDTFGSTSINPNPLDIFELAFGPDIPVYNIQEIIEIISDLGLQTISYENREFGSRNIYIGAYGSEKGKYAIINDDLLQKLLDDKLSIDEFIQLVISNYTSKSVTKS